MECRENVNYSNESLVNLYKTTKDNDYLQMLYEKNFNLFFKLSYRYSSISWEYTQEDLMSECYIALCKTVEYYRPDSAPFFNFLYRITNQYLWKICNGNSGTIELAKKKKKKMAYTSIYEVICTDKDGNDVMLLDAIADEEAQKMIDDLPEIMFTADLNKVLNKAISSLSERQEAVVRALNGFESATYTASELAGLFGVNRSRIHEIKSNAYRNLRQNKQVKKIWEMEFEHRY